MRTEKMISILRAESDKHRNDKVYFGDVNISLMLFDVANRLEELDLVINKFNELEKQGYVLQLDEEKDGLSVETLLPIRDVISTKQ